MKISLEEAYKILGLESNSTIEQIKSAYKKLVLKTHPDRGGNQADFIRVQSAYEILCKFHKSGAKIEDFEIPIPDELKNIIKDIVSQFSNVQDICQLKSEAFYNNQVYFLKNATREQLKNYNEKFHKDWSDYIKNLFGDFNSDCRALVLKYDQWFYKSLENVFEEMYQRELKNYKKSPKFYMIFLITSIILSTISYKILIENKMSPYLISASMFIVGFLFSLMLWRSNCESNKRDITSLELLQVEPFNLNENFRFSGSESLKNGSELKKETTSAGGSMGVLFAIASGKNFFGDALIGGAIGLAVGSLIDRFKNPTEKIRNELIQELDNLMEAVYPEIVEYTLNSHQEFLESFSSKVIENYNNRIKKTIYLLTEGKKP